MPYAHYTAEEVAARGEALYEQQIRPHVEAAAAKQALSVSEYCVRAITSQLIRDDERPPRAQDHHQLEAAITKARQFHAETFSWCYTVVPTLSHNR